MLVLSNVLLWVLVLLNILLSWGIIRRVRQLDQRLADAGSLYPEPAPVDPLPPGTPAPDFQVSTPAGDTLTREQVVQGETVLAFFAPSCSTCVEHLPDVRRYASDVRPVGTRLVAVVEGPVSEGRQFVDRLDGVVPVTFADHDNPMARDYRVDAYPSYYVIDADGRVRTVHHRIEELPKR